MCVPSLPPLNAGGRSSSPRLSSLFLRSAQAGPCRVSSLPPFVGMMGGPGRALLRLVLHVALLGTFCESRFSAIGHSPKFPHSTPGMPSPDLQRSDTRSPLRSPEQGTPMAFSSLSFAPSRVSASSHVRCYLVCLLACACLLSTPPVHMSVKVLPCPSIPCSGLVGVLCRFGSSVCAEPSPGRLVEPSRCGLQGCFPRPSLSSPGGSAGRRGCCLSAGVGSHK